MRAKMEASQSPGVRQRVANLRDARQLGATELARFPRADAMLEALALSDRCRVAAGALDGLARHAADFDAPTLRSRARGIIRALVAELALALCLTGCTVEPVAAPDVCTRVTALDDWCGGTAGYLCPADLEVTPGFARPEPQGVVGTNVGWCAL